MRSEALKRAFLVALVCVSGCAGTGHVRSSSGPGSGYLTQVPSMVRPLRSDYRVTPILTAGDTLVSPQEGAPAFIFFGRAAGLGARDRGDGTVDLYVAHEDAWLEGFQGGVISRLALDLRNAGVLDATYVVRPDRGYQGLSHAALLDSKVGFLHPEFVFNERGHRSRAPMVGAIDALSGAIQDLPWLGAMRHKSTIALPATGGRTLMILVGGPSAGSIDQLFMYLANSDTDVLVGNGRLYVFRADPTAIPYSSRSASRLRKGLTVRGEFIAIPGDAARSTAALDGAVQGLGCLNFIRLEGIAIDRERPNAFYFTDRLGAGQVGFTQSNVAGGGRLYHVALDPFDPTKVEEFEVVLDAGEGDDIFRPTTIDTDDRSVMIQEYPGTRGVHPARILRYDTRERRLEAVAVCAERDTRGRVDPAGIGGDWETSGITNVSDIFGEDSWLFTVQAHTVEVWQDRYRRGEGGQLLILRGPRHPAPPSPPAAAEETKPEAP